ncbi:MAG: tRNA (adenosine(37)-N6)-dimethylallyltransferase MiaA [Candidatus Adlerbacteria bacterium]
MHKPKVIAVVGPTASGKTALGIFLAQKLGGEIISADSRQVYKGTAAISRTPNKKEQAGIPHHLIGLANPKRFYSAGEFVQDAQKILTDIGERNKIPIVVGGTGFYADSLLRGLQLPDVPPNKKLRTALAKKTAPQLFAMLQKLDSNTAARIDRHNPARLVRAIEIAKALGAVPEITYNSPYNVLWFGLLPEKKKHEKAIRAGVAARVTKMITEVKKLRPTLSKKQFATLGFEFVPLADYIDKEITKKELVEKLIREELGYVKRQMRWFKRHKDIVWVKNKTEALKQAKAFTSTSTKL